MDKLIKKIFETQVVNEKQQFFLKFLFFYFIPALILNNFFNDRPFQILVLQFILSVIIINVCLKYLGEINEKGVTVKKLSFWILLIIGVFPFSMAIFCFFLIISPKSDLYKKLTKICIYILGALVFSIFINSCVFPLQVLLPGKKAWPVYENGYDTIIIDESSDIDESIIVVKQMLSLKESNFKSSNREASSLDNLFAPYSVETFYKCEKPQGCDVLRPGDRLKLVGKFYNKHLGVSGFFNSNNYYFVAVDEQGRHIEILDFMMHDFEKPIKDDGRIFKIKKDFYGEQDKLVKEVSAILKNFNSSSESRMVEIINDSLLTLDASNKIISLILNYNYEYNNLVFEALFSSEKIDYNAKRLLFGKLSVDKIHSLLDSSHLNKQILDEIFEGMIISKTLNEPLLIKKALSFKLLSKYDEEVYIGKLINSKSGIMLDEELLKHLIDTYLSSGSVRGGLIDFIINDFNNLPHANNLFKQIIESKNTTKLQLIYDLKMIRDSYKPVPETGAYLLAILTSSKVDDELIEKIKEVLSKVGNNVLYGDEIRKIVFRVKN